MKKGQIILGVASAVIAVGSGLAFKVAHKFSNHPIYGKTAASTTTNCKLCHTYFTGSSITAPTKCRTSAQSGARTLFATVHNSKDYFFTKLTTGGVHCGASQVTKVSTNG